MAAAFGPKRWERRHYAVLPLLVLFGIAISSPAPAGQALLISPAGQKLLLSTSRTPAVGPRDANVVVIEYFDYNCPVCKKLQPTLRALLAKDPKVAIVYKDWAILGDVSVYAARSALAAKWQGKYLAAHDALMAQPRLPDDARVDAVLASAGIDMAKLRRDRSSHGQEIDALLAHNDEEAQSLKFRGTPGLLVGRLVVPGSVDLPGLERLVERARNVH
jgi:protein-disulfide isomerase